MSASVTSHTCVSTMCQQFKSEKEIKHKLLEINYEEMQKTIPVTRNSISNFTHGCKNRALDISSLLQNKYLYINLEKHALL